MLMELCYICSNQKKKKLQNTTQEGNQRQKSETKISIADNTTRNNFES
jgi:hypothetical protein